MRWAGPPSRPARRARTGCSNLGLGVECLSDQAVTAYSAGGLTVLEAATAKTHLATCSSCRGRVQRSLESQGTLGGAGAVGTAATLASGDPSATAATMHGARTGGSGGGLGAGAKLGRYEIRSVLGRGGMGVVYSAFDPDLDRKIAVKLLHAELAADTRVATTRLLREGRAIAKLAHPNVVAVFDVGTHDGAVFIAMELVVGRSLDVWIAEQPRPWREVVRVFLQAGEGLVAAHAAGLVHRDFKPANVLLGIDGRARVTDFGVARIDGTPRRRSAPSLTDTADLRLTETGAMIGTPAYMPPEQLDGSDVDARSDQFSFAVALYEALYGERPFAGSTFGELYDNVTSERVRAAPVATAVPAWLRGVVLRGMRASREERYPSLPALLDDLRRDPGARRRRLAVGGGLAVLGCIAGGLLLAARGDGVAPVDCAGNADRQLAGWREGRARLPPSATLEKIDASVAEWRTAAINGCTKPNPDPVLRGLEQACLTWHVDAFETLAAQLEQPSEGMLSFIGEQEASADTPARCVDHRRTSYPVPLPGDPAKRKLGIAARAKYLRAAEHGPELSVEAAEALAREAVGLAEQSGHGETIARAYSALGGALLDRNDVADAVSAFRKSITAAERGEALAVLAFSHVLLANTLCNAPGEAGACDAEIERAEAYFTKHPDEEKLQFDLTYAGYEGARLRPEAGAARLHAWIAKHPDAAMDPYMGNQLARLEFFDGRPVKALGAIDATLAAARKSGPPSLVADLLEGRCSYALELARMSDAKASLAELVTIETSSPEVKIARLVCETGVRIATGDLAGASTAAADLMKLDQKARGWYVALLLVHGRVAEARAIVGPPDAKLVEPIDWSGMASLNDQFDVAFAAHELATARTTLETLTTKLRALPATSFTLFDATVRRTQLELTAGKLDDARAAIDRAASLIAARGDDASHTQQLKVAALAAELCLRGTETATCAPPLARALAPVVASGALPLDAHVASLLLAGAAQPIDRTAMCREWTWLAAFRTAPLVLMLDSVRIARTCR